MKITNSNQKQSFKGELRIISYKDLGQGLIKIIQKMPTTPNQDEAAMKLCDSLDLCYGTRRLTKKAFNQLTKHFEPLTGNLKWSKETKSSLVVVKGITFGDTDVEKAGGLLLDLKI